MYASPGAAVAAKDQAAVTFKLVHPQRFLESYLVEEVRPDGRGLLDFRNTSINLGSVNTADGSSLVRIGNTTVTCGIKAELTNPPIDRPDQGWIVPNVTMLPMCCDRIRRGPPTHQAQVLSQYVNTVLNTPGIINFKELCLASGKLSWVLYIDAYVLNHDGNLVDACMLAVVAALSDLRLPRMTPVEEEIPRIIEPKAVQLSLGPLPFTVSFGQFRDHVLADPTDEEEAQLHATIALTQDSSGNVISISQPSPGSEGLAASGCNPAFSLDQIMQCCGQTKERVNHLASLLATAMESK